MKRRWIVLVLCCLLAVFAMACEQTEAKKEETPTTIKVGLLLMGSPSDKYSASYYGYEAFKQLEKNYGVEITYNEYVTPKNASYLLNNYSRKGYNLIIAQGEELEEAMLETSVNYPEITYACIDGKNGKDNVASYDLLQEDLVYIAGAITTGLTVDPQVGYMELEGV